MKTVFILGIDDNGYIYFRGGEKSAKKMLMCPFNPKNIPCGIWCPHCGNIRENQYGQTFSIELTCGNGTNIVSDIREFSHGMMDPKFKIHEPEGGTNHAAE